TRSVISTVADGFSPSTRSASGFGISQHFGLDGGRRQTRYVYLRPPRKPIVPRCSAMRSISRRTTLRAGAAAIVTPMIIAPIILGARAQDVYPNRVIKLVVPWPAGGITDVIGRLIAQKLSSELGQTMVVENRAGASGTIGPAAVAQSAADGYTLLLGTNSTYAIPPHLFERLPYDGDKAFAPISLVARSPQILSVHPAMTVKDFRGLLDYVRARQPSGVSFESAGPGSTSHLA